MLKIYFFFKEIPANVLKELFVIAKEPTGVELLNMMKYHKSPIKKEITVLQIKQKLLTTYTRFFDGFANIKNNNEENDLVQIECETELFNNLILIATIILNDNMKNEAERTLQNYLEIFFKQLDEKNSSENKPKNNINVNSDCEEDSSSQYSTLSSFLGLPVKSVSFSKLVLTNFYFNNVRI